MSEKNIGITLKIWRQKNATSEGRFETYKMDAVSTASSFLEMMDLLNEQLIAEDKTPSSWDERRRYYPASPIPFR